MAPPRHTPGVAGSTAASSAPIVSRTGATGRTTPISAIHTRPPFAGSGPPPPSLALHGQYHGIPAGMTNPGHTGASLLGGPPTTSGDMAINGHSQPPPHLHHPHPVLGPSEPLPGQMNIGANGHMGNAGQSTTSSTPGIGPGGPAEAHTAAIRSVVEKGIALNTAAAQEQGYSTERKRNLPPILQRLSSETEACYSEIGIIAWNLGDSEKALRSFEEALRRDPLCVQALQGMARYSKEQENWSRTVDYAARSLALDDTGCEGEMWSVVGHALLFLGQLHKAYSCYQQAIAKAVRKDDPKLWYGIGILYDRYGSMEHAEEAFASVLKLDPSTFASWENHHCPTEC